MRTTHGRRLGWAACLMVAATAVAASGPPALHSGFDLAVPVAPAPVVVGGVRQLVYELQVYNAADAPMTLERVDVLADGQVLDTLAAPALASRLHGGSQPAGALAPTLAPGVRATLYIEVSLPPDLAPRALSHRIAYLAAGGAVMDPWEVQGGTTLLDTSPVPVLGPPLRGGPWAAIHHPDWPRGHRRMVYAVNGRARIPGRQAIDFVRLDTQGRQASGDVDRPRSWFGHGEEVLAVADGVVVAVRDDMREGASIEAHPRQALADASGNALVLRIAPQRYAFYEHLLPGSVRVAVGDRVRRGDTLAALGFTGDSTGPHLHFHVADAGSPLDAEGMPFVFDGFRLVGRYDALDGLGSAPWLPLRDDAPPPMRRAERPPPNHVLQFLP